MLRLPVYLDNNATTKMDPRVFEAMVPYYMEYYGNAASSTHLFGWEAKDAVDQAREQVSKLIGANANEIVFTSGATESINLAIKGICEFYEHKGIHIITVATEHKAVLDTCMHVEKAGVEITYLPVAESGLIDLEVLIKAIKQNTVLIAVMFANNETGVLQPVADIAAIAKSHDVLFFCDATQAAGKIPFNVKTLGIDMLAFSAHKIYGPKGVGVLYTNRKNPSLKIIAQIDGGGHEKGLRSGTLNVPGIVGIGAAAALCFSEMESERLRIGALRNELESQLLQIPGTFLNGDPEKRMFNVCNISFKGREGRSLMNALSKHIALSSGSACTSVIQEPSYVLRAMGLEHDLASSAFRFSLGRFTTAEEIEYAVARVVDLTGF
jgi:cysteine desulfurase